ncbi:family 20 glycosylhydrolase [Roseibacillus persicicus]|uniref:family 20 glycosylhydrolase n=1 Tax=Roseibacillus persicicus TaxID=454148 RepID=UPI00280E618D|nr:family 20 glycosylhydrolase [Roseibacillus persicicus]MDQ8189801.1 family 20 glycosylhydrolase [Roseibacillus persicicus]
MKLQFSPLTVFALASSLFTSARSELVAAYDFEGGSLSDISGNGRLASVVGGVMAGPESEPERGAVFNLTGGSGSESNPGTYLELPVAGTQTGSWSLAMWIRDGEAKNSYLFDNRDVVGGGGGAARLIFSTEHNAPSGGIGLFNGSWAGASTPIRDGEWHHVVWAYEGEGQVLTLFTDGVGVAGSYAAADLLTSSVRLGNRSGDGAPGVQNGRLVDDVYLYNHALSETEVSALIAATGPSPEVEQPFQITTILADPETGTVDLTWNSRNLGSEFDVLATGDLEQEIGQWEVEAALISNAGDTTSTQLTGVTEEKRFFVVRETPPPTSDGTALIPFPSSLEVSDEEPFRFSSSSRILFETRTAPRSMETTLAPLAEVLAGEFEILTGDLPDVIELGAAGTVEASDIVLRFDAPANPFPVSEAEEAQSYTLTSGANGVEVRASYYKGVAYGTATLLQSLGEDEDGFYVRAMAVEDEADAGYRAIMLDVARQVHSIEVIKDVVRVARLFKIRYIQLHLTDDQNFTFPFPAVTDGLTGNFTYTKEQLDDLVAYADARGVTLIPEMDLPGHSSKLKQSGYLNPSSSDGDVAAPANFSKIQAIMDEMLEVFASSPYFHIGGDESAAGSALEPFLAAMNEHLRDDPPGGKRRMLVWEGFGGAPVDELPATGDDRIIVMSWESSYNAPWNLLEAGYEIINASWKPMYVVGGGTLFHPGSTGGKKFFSEDIHRWNKDIFMHWEPGRPVFEDLGPQDADRTDHEWDSTVLGREDQILGGQLLFWEQEEKSVVNQLLPRISATAERLWNPTLDDDFATLSARTESVMVRLLPIIQPVEILPAEPADSYPITDIYQPYEGSQVQVTLRNRTRIPGTIRYEIGSFSNNLTGPYFPAPSAPGTGSTAYLGPFQRGGGFSVRARLFRQDDGSLVGGDSFTFFNNWPNRVKVTDYDIGELGGSQVPDMTSFSVDDVLREYELPMLRGAFRNVELVGQLQEAMLTPPGSGDYVLSAKTQSGHASVYLDLNRNGIWEANEKLISDTPNSEVEQTAAAVTLEAGTSYPLRVDHKTGIPRPVLVVYLNGPGTGGRVEISPYLSLPN